MQRFADRNHCLQYSYKRNGMCLHILKWSKIRVASVLAMFNSWHIPEPQDVHWLITPWKATWSPEKMEPKDVQLIEHDHLWEPQRPSRIWGSTGFCAASKSDKCFFNHAVIHWRNRSCSQQQLPRWPETCATSDRKGAEPCRFWCCACQSDFSLPDFALTMNWKWLDSQPVYVKFFGSHPSNILNKIHYFIFQSVTAHQASCGAVARRVLVGSCL